MNVVILKERQESGGTSFVRCAVVQVPDNAADPETTAWTLWTRNVTPEPGNYAAVRLGKRFAATRRAQTVTSALGAMA